MRSMHAIFKFLKSLSILSSFFKEKFLFQSLLNITSTIAHNDLIFNYSFVLEFLSKQDFHIRIKATVFEFKMLHIRNKLVVFPLRNSFL